MTHTGGTKIGPYVVTRELGRGGMGVVYLARDARLERDVAIKVLPESTARDKERILRFSGERPLRSGGRFYAGGRGDLVSVWAYCVSPLRRTNSINRLSALMRRAMNPPRVAV